MIRRVHLGPLPLCSHCRAKPVRRYGADYCGQSCRDAAEHRRVRQATDGSRCIRCGALLKRPIDAVACCLFAPKPSGWCAWCGDDVKPGRVFCSPKCSQYWFADRRDGSADRNIGTLIAAMQ